MRIKLSVHVLEVKNKSGTSSFRVDMGKVNGIRKFKQFPSKESAEKFAHQCNVNIEAKNFGALGDVSEVMVHRYEFLNCLNRLKEIGATVTQATDYFIKFARPSNGKIPIGNLIRDFVAEKTKVGCSQKYLGSITRFDFHVFTEHFGEDINISEVTAKQFSDYLYNKTTWGPVSKLSHIRVMSMFFNYALKKGYVTRNPILEVELPRQVGKAPAILKIKDATNLLRTAEKQKMCDRLTICALVLFCGVRVEEAVKLRWSNFNWKIRTIDIPFEIAKKRRARINNIPSNAFEWIILTRPNDYRTNRNLILEGDWKSKLSYLRKQSGLEYSQNAMRHSFASYHLQHFQSPALTCLQLGHVGNVNTLYSHYRNSCSRVDAERYFNILPKVLKRVDKKKKEEPVLTPTKNNRRELSFYNSESPN